MLLLLLTLADDTQRHYRRAIAAIFHAAAAGLRYFDAAMPMLTLDAAIRPMLIRRC